MKDYEDAVLAVCSAQEGADYLVTRDEDFLVAEGCPVQVVSPGTLLEMLNCKFPSFALLLFSFCPPSDYCLTTIFQKPEKPWEPRRAKGFHGFCKWALNLWDVPETRMKPGFLL